MNNNYLKYYKPSLLITIIIILGVAVVAAKDYWGLSISVISIVTLLLVFITNYLWKYKPFIFLFEINDFSGRYEGILTSFRITEEGNPETKELRHVKIINQSGSRITVSSFTIREDGTKSTVSVNKGMYVEKTEDERHYRLIYSYENAGCIERGFPPHYGTDEIKFVKKDTGEKVLFGQYYTNRNPQTKGVYNNLKWVSNDLNHEF